MKKGVDYIGIGIGALIFNNSTPRRCTRGKSRVRLGVAKRKILWFTKSRKSMEKKIQEQAPLVQNPDSDIIKSIFTKRLFTILIVTVILGGISGYVLSNKKSQTGNTFTSGSVNSSSNSKGTIVGSDDTKTFKDTAVGALKGGGIKGEGQFHLIRPGGDSQNVYLTSSSVDLSKFVSKKIKVWGETQKAQYAGWLMDVGRVEVVE